MHRVDPDREALAGPDAPSSEGAPDAPRSELFATTAAGRVWRMLAIVLGGAFTGMLIGAPVGLAANAVGVPSGGAAAFAALAFLTLALAARSLALRTTRRIAAEVTPLFDDSTEEHVEREAA
jgi:hypothetical protein